MAVTGFSGTVLAAEKIAPGVDPVDRTFIDPSGPALRIFDVSSLGGAPAGQLVTPPVRLEFPAKDIGQVFGLVFDEGVAGGPPNLYAAATSAFGLNIVGSTSEPDGKPVRLKAGAPGAAFMEGQFGALSSGSPSAIYKIDGATGAVSNVADTAFAGSSNSGPGIGGLAFDPDSRSLYASDLDSGLIHRFGLDNNNADLAQYDHGVAGRRAKALDPVADDGRRLQLTDPAFKPNDPATWGFTQPQRRIDALAVHGGRLFYAVADGPEIWSVGLSAGAFLDDARLEVKVKAQKPYPITGIAFDGNGRMLLAQRGPLKSPYDYASFVEAGGEVLRYAPEQPDDPTTPDLWAPEPATYAVGTSDDSRAADGGVSMQYGYKPDGTLDTSVCNATVAMTGDTLTATAHGVQLEGIELVRPANVPPKESAYIKWAQTLDDPAARGYAGGIAVLHTCAGGSGGGFPLVAGDDSGGGAGFPPLVDGGGGGGGTLPDVVSPGGVGGQTLPDVVDPGGSGGKVQVGPLTIEKVGTTAACNDTVPCSFDIKVSNTTDKPVAGPIVIDDALSVAGAPAGESVLAAAPPAPWTCAQVFGPTFNCTHPGPIPANGALPNLSLSFGAGPLGTATEVRNCASLGTPGAAPALPPDKPSEEKGLRVVTKATSTSCASGVPCTWQVTATNIGATPITGLMVSGLHMVGSSAGLGVENKVTEQVSSSAPPGATCNPGPVFSGTGPVCSNPQMTLAPGADLTFTYTVKINTPAGTPIDFFDAIGFVNIRGAKEADEAGGAAFATVKKTPDGPQAGEAQPAGDAGTPKPQACATIPVSTQTGPVVITKKAVGKCTAKGPCAFTITMRNTGNFDIEPGFVIAEQIDAPQATLVGTPKGPWSCKTAAPFECTLTEKLLAGSSADLELSFAPNTPPAKTTLKNCAIALTGVGGKNPPANQIAPGKKTEVPPILKSLVQLAKFTAQSFPAQNGLLHLTGAGGNIGGVTNECLKRGPPPAFSVQQADGTAITFDNVSIDPAGNLRGNARIFSGRKGTIDGTFNGSLLSFRLRWSDGTIGDYTAKVDADGMIAGLTRDIAGGPNVKFNGLQPWPCAKDALCTKYSETAKQSADTNIRLKCGNPPVDRWSPDINHHLTWCMAQSRGADSPIQTEEAARTAALSACADKVERCRDVENVAQKKAAEFKKRDCENVPFSGGLTDPEIRQNACMLNDEAGQSKVAEIQDQILNDCIAKQAAAGGGGGAGGAPGNAGDAGGGVGGQPSPEQCATVPIEPDGAPAPAGVGPATAANGLQINKAVAPGAPCTNANCAFTITVKNTNAAPMPGPIKVIDLAQPELPGGQMGPIVSGKIVSGPTAPWTCAKRPPQNIDFECTHPGPLAAGETSTINMAIGFDAGVALDRIKNCGILDDNAFVCADAPIAQVQPPAPPAVGSQTAANGLQINKVVTPGTTCTKSNCSFTITLKNTSGVPIPGPIPVIDNPTVVLRDGKPGAPLTTKLVSTPPAPWKCEKPNEIQFKCEHLDPIAAGETKTLNLVIDLGADVANFDVATVKNCGFLDEKTAICAEAPVVQVAQVAPDEPPPAPPGGAKQLVLTKNPVAEKCSDTGGGCDFVVSITNTGDTDFTSPIAFNDLLSTADGTPLPNADFGSVQVAGATGPDISAPFVCKVGGGALTCSTGDLKVKIPPKRTITFPMSIKPGPAGGATAIKNCAQMQLDQFAEPVCRTIPLVNGPLLRATKLSSAGASGSPTCTPECFFSVSIKNVGNADAIGPFAFTDRFTPNSKIVAISAESGDFTCRLDTGQGNGVAVCNGNKQRLAPGEQMLGKMAVRAVPLAPEYTNCVEIVQSGAPVDTAAPNRCATIKEARPERVDLFIQKFAVDKPKAGNKTGECKLEGPCTFLVNISNEGNTAYNGPITFTDEIPEKISGKVQSVPGSIEAKPNPDWTCTKSSPRAISCTHKLTTLAAHNAVGLEIVVMPGPNWKKNEVLTNCAGITTPVGNDAGDNKVNDKDCASAELDPFSVKVSKTGDQVCAPGSNCTFKLNLFNPGPIPHNAPVTIADKLTGLSSAQIVSINPPLPCASQPTQIPFSCTSLGPVRLDLDAAPGSEFGPRDYVMVVKLPNDASGEQFSNCATVSGDTGSSAEACVSVATKPITPAGSCEGGKVMTARGCACPMPTKFNGTVCVGAGGINTTPSPATAPPAAPPPVATSPAPPSCRGGMILIENTCACPALTTWKGRECVRTAPRPPVTATPAPPTCRGGMILIEGSCACPPAMVWKGSKCVGTGGINTSKQPDAEPPPVVTSPAPQPLPKRLEPTCPANSRLINEKCECRQGFEPDRRGACQPKRQEPQQPKCPENSRLKNGACQCLPGFEPTRRGRECRPVRQAPQTPPQQQPTPQQRPFEKTCPDGTKVFGQFTQCPNDKPQRCPPKTPNGTFPNCCPRQMQFRNGECVDDKCRRGMVGTPPNCACPPGTTFQNDRCRVPAGPAPKPVPQAPPQQPKCGPGFGVVNGQCVCPRRKEVIEGQCVDKIQ